MDIQTSVFQNYTTVGQSRVDPQPQQVKSQQSEKGSPSVSGHHATEVMDRLTQKLVEQSDNSDKVAAIKAKIAAGTFEIDAGKIADKLLWGERIAAMSDAE
jgi:flagellar biosynthesis anti-sigma factor FlgM